MCRPTTDAPPYDPFPDYDGPDPEPVDDVDVPPGCWCHDATPCPDLVAGILADRDPIDPYRGEP